MHYRISYTKTARQTLREMPGNYRQRARRMIENLGDNPRPPGAKELRGLPEHFRVRPNGWRVIYRVDKGSLSLLVLAIRLKSGPETYEGLST